MNNNPVVDVGLRSFGMGSADYFHSYYFAKQFPRWTIGLPVQQNQASVIHRRGLSRPEPSRRTGCVSQPNVDHCRLYHERVSIQSFFSAALDLRWHNGQIIWQRITPQRIFIPTVRHVLPREQMTQLKPPLGLGGRWLSRWVFNIKTGCLYEQIIACNYSRKRESVLSVSNMALQVRPRIKD